MKKLISIDDLHTGMFLEADVATEGKDGEEQRFLEARDALSTGTKGKRARLTGGMYKKVKKEGGLLIPSEAVVKALKQTGLTMVTIDTDKGGDLPESVKPLTDPNRKPPPAGRMVHFDEEIERAKEARAQTTETLKETMADVASGQGLDVDKIQAASEVITESILRNVDAMVSLTRIKQHDPYTAMHSMNVCTLVVAMANADENVPSSTLPTITTAALLHDVGKTRVTLEILNKPGRFEPDELAEMRKHVQYSRDILEEVGGFPEETIAIATQHHEMMNGSGYPAGLKGDEIHPFGRMTAVADVYDALTAKRVYKPGMPMHQALQRIHQNRGTEFDEATVDLVIKVLGIYPVSTLVELSTKEQALVFEPNPDAPRKPTVAVLTMPNRKPRAAPFIMNLNRRSEAEGREIVKVLNPEQVQVDVEELMQDIERRGERTERRMR